MPEQPRAAIYVRVSTTKQEKEGTSLDSQEAACRAFAAQRGWQVREVHREILGGDLLWQRPQLTLMREAMRRREINAVVVYAIDRLSRDAVHVGVVLTEAQQACVEVAFVTEPLDDTPEGQLLRFIKGYVAKIEHEKIKERTQRGRMSRVKANKLLVGHRAAYGYRWADEDKSRYQVNPDTAPVLRDIFEKAAAGMPIRGIVAYLNDRGIPTPSGAPRWIPSVVHLLLHSRMYVGQAFAFRSRWAKNDRGTWSGTSLPESEWIPLPAGTVPALIDAETFAAVQERLTRNKQQAVRSARHPEWFLLRGGFARCALCGSTMIGRYDAQRDQRRYRCGQNGNSQAPACSKPTIASPALDEAVWTRIASLLTDPALIEAELIRLREDDVAPGDLATVDRMLAEVEKRRRNLQAMVERLDDPEDAAEFGPRIADLGAQRRRLLEERAGIEAQAAQREQSRRQLRTVQEWATQVAANLDLLSYDDRRLALEALGAQVTVWPRGTEPRYTLSINLPVPQPASDGKAEAVLSSTTRRGGRGAG